MKKELRVAVKGTALEAGLNEKPRFKPKPKFINKPTPPKAAPVVQAPPPKPVKAKKVEVEKPKPPPPPFKTPEHVEKYAQVKAHQHSLPTQVVAKLLKCSSKGNAQRVLKDFLKGDRVVSKFS